MKKEKGFTLIELVVAMAILALISVPIFKAFVVSTKVNVKSYEKDGSNIAVVNKIEEIKKNPYKFMIKDHKDKTTTRYYTSYFSAAYYYCSDNLDTDRKNGTIDQTAFKEYVENYFHIYPKAGGWNNPNNKDETPTQRSQRFNASGEGSYKDKQFCDKNYLRNNISYIPSITAIVNKCNITEYYDSNWNKSSESADYKYQMQVDVSRKSENQKTSDEYNQHLLDNKRKHGVPEDVKKSSFVVLKEEGSDYWFYVFDNYSNEDFESDYEKIRDKTVREKSGDMARIIDKMYSEKKRSNDENIIISKYQAKVVKDPIRVQVRIDFNRNSVEPKYELDVYNMTKKSMELYIVHSGKNSSEVTVNVIRGKVEKTEVGATKNFKKTVYKIDIAIRKKGDKNNLINYKTEKYAQNGDADDLNVANIMKDINE